MNRCKRCLYPDTKPDLLFDEEGICSACRNYEARPEVDWDKRLEMLRAFVEGERVIVPSSGGKDSTYIALRLKQLGADVTAVTATTCHLTPIGRENLDNLARHVRTIEVTPNMTVRGKLNRLSLELVGDPSWPEHVSIHRVPFRIARDLGIKKIFYGECPNNQYGGPDGTRDISVMTQRWASEFGGFLGLRTSDFVGQYGITTDDMRDYEAPDDAELADHGIVACFLGWFEPWDSERNAEVSSAAGMKQVLPSFANWWPAENLDNAQTGLHDHMCYRKYGYGRAAAQLSVDIRAGKISREYGLKFAKQWDGLFPWKYAGVPFVDVLDRLGMTEKEIMAAVNQHTNWSLFDGELNGRPTLKEWV